MKQVILGTAGHIDHGKTSLIKAVTGIDTDRLKEEQLRGITIELGFTSFTLPGGQSLGVVDVPGHEKFVKNMVAGATGIDILVMVVAADEGVMPQTREHMEICSLLGIKYGLVVLTKTDMVGKEWLELVEEDISEFTNNTFLENSPIIPVSSVTGHGLTDFVNVLSRLCRKIPERPFSGMFRLPVDRVFTMKGFGTVVTGTLVSGKTSVGDLVMVYPRRTKSKIRGVQVYGESVKTAKAGMRTAINFQGLSKGEIYRGDVIAAKNTLINTYMVDLFFSFLKSNKKSMKNRTRVRFHTGTSEVMGNVFLMDRDELFPGESCFVQIRLESPVVLIKGDRFVIRSYSPVRTIGGGEVLNPIPEKKKRFREETMMGFKILSTGTIDEIIEYHVKLAKSTGISFDKLIIATRMSEKSLNSKIASNLNKRSMVQIGKNDRVYLHADTFKALVEYAKELLRDYHARYPIKEGMFKEELKSRFPFDVSSKLFTIVLNRMVKNEEILIKKDLVRLADHVVELKIDQEKIKKQIVEIYHKKDLAPPYFKDVVKSICVEVKEAKPVLELLINENVLVKVKEELYYYKVSLDRLEQELTEFLVKNGEITTLQFKAMTRASRKYAIPLIEYFDSTKVTIRVGDTRKLRRQQ